MCVRCFLFYFYFIYFEKSAGKEHALSLPYSFWQQDYLHMIAIIINKFKNFCAVYFKRSPGVA
jgi:hypothetical protein